MLCLLLSLISCTIQSVVLDDPSRADPPGTEIRSPGSIPTFTLDSTSRIDPVTEPPLTPDETDRICTLIAQLATIDTPDIGYSPTMAGYQFAAVDGMRESTTLLMTSHGLSTHPAVRELVSIGPRAVPLLLGSLSDPTPTSFVVRDGRFFDNMEFACELLYNPLWEREANAIKPLLERRRVPQRFEHDCTYEPPNMFRESRKYTLKVGDICFVILGQITGRAYTAVRYQPSACMVLCSPVEDVAMRDALVQVWSASRPEENPVLEALSLDWRLRGRYSSGLDDTLNNASFFQSQAALRLLYYYPMLTRESLVARLDSLDLHCPWVSPLNSGRRACKAMAFVPMTF